MTVEEVNKTIIENCKSTLVQVENIFLTSTMRVIEDVNKKIADEKDEFKKLAFESYRDGMKDAVGGLKGIVEKYLKLLDTSEAATNEWLSTL